MERLGQLSDLLLRSHIARTEGLFHFPAIDFSLKLWYECKYLALIRIENFDYAIPIVVSVGVIVLYDPLFFQEATGLPAQVTVSVRSAGCTARK